MPKIRILEEDRTIGQVPTTDNGVFLPLRVKTGKEFDIVEVTSVVKLREQVESVDVEDKGYFIAEKLLNAGYTLVVQGVELSTDIDWLIEDGGIGDKSLFDVRFITLGNFDHSSTLQEKALTAARERGDAIALIDPPVGDTTPVAILAHVESVGKEDGAYGAMFAPWVKFLEDDVEVNIPPSVAYLLAHADSVRRGNPLWLATAGAKRGKVPGLVGLVANYGTRDINTLGQRDSSANSLDTLAGVAVNPIANIRPHGNIIWGNRTLYPNEENELKASSFLNIRLLVSELKKVLYKASRSNTFEQNTELLWTQFTALVYPILDQMISGSGISSYKLIKEPTDAKARLKATIRITPIEAVEDFDLTVELVDDDAIVVE